MEFSGKKMKKMHKKVKIIKNDMKVTSIGAFV